MKAVLASALMLISTIAPVASAQMVDQFSDLATDHPQYYEIMYLSRKKVLQGYEDGTFRADEVVSRAESLKIIMLSAGTPVKSGKSMFSDVRNSHWSRNFINTAYRTGIVQGYRNGNFQPDNTVTYEEAVKMIANAYDVIPSRGRMQYDNWFSPYKSFLEQNNIKVPADQDLSAGMTRGDLAELMYKIYMTTNYGK